jgi:hypothetical protein
LSEDEKKLRDLAEDFGFSDVDEMLEASVIDSVCPAICMSCDYTTEMEPDQDQGWCEMCDTNTVKSALILAGMI